MLGIENLAYRANGRTILERIDLDVREREIHALLGANGSGKTTLARIVMGCAGYAPSAGTVRFDGRDLAGLAVHERARRVADRASYLCGGRITFTGDPAAAAERDRERAR